jgi:hypothetical protein
MMSKILLNIFNDNITTRVRAKNAKAWQRQIHDKSQHFTARNQDNTDMIRLLLSRLHII